MRLDLATVIGLALGIAIVAFGFGIDPAHRLPDAASMLITLGGTLAATLISFPPKTLIGALAALKGVLFPGRIDYSKDIDSIVEIANVVRSDGMLALEDAAAKAEEHLLRKGILLMVGGMDRASLQAILRSEIGASAARERQSAGVYKALSGYAVAFGGIGALFALMKAFSGYGGDTAALLGGIAAAAGTMACALLLSRLIAAPLGEKLLAHSARRALRLEIIAEGLGYVQEGLPPRMIYERLMGLAQSHGAQMRGSGSGETAEI